MRCKPDEVSRDREAVAAALSLLAGDAPPGLDALAAAVGYAPHHFQRLFKRDVGVSPAQYARALKARRASDMLTHANRVADAIYDAGYSGPSRFYESAKSHLGMTPSAWRNGGAGVTIRWAVAETWLGPMLVAVTDKGICRLSFHETGDALHQPLSQSRPQAG